MFPNEAMSHLSKGLPTATTLQFLSLKGCNIGDDGLHSLLEGLKGNKSIQQLELSECGLSDKSGIRIGLLIKVGGWFIIFFLRGSKLRAQHLRATRDTDVSSDANPI